MFKKKKKNHHPFVLCCIVPVKSISLFHTVEHLGKMEITERFKEAIYEGVRLKKKIVL